MKGRQFIRDEHGKPLFIVLPMAEYEKLANVDQFGFEYDDETESDLLDLEAESAENDSALIPHEVIALMVKNNVNLLGAWRLFRGLSQQEVAERLGLTQSAISQAERRESKPQKKTLERFAVIYECDVAQMS